MYLLLCKAEWEAHRKLRHGEFAAAFKLAYELVTQIYAPAFHLCLVGFVSRHIIGLKCLWRDSTILFHGDEHTCQAVHAQTEGGNGLLLVIQYLLQVFVGFLAGIGLRLQLFAKRIGLGGQSVGFVA